MPSFDIVSEVDKQEIDNAINQSRKELSTRFDFKDSKATVEMTDPALIELTAEDAGRLKSLMEIVIGKFAKRNIDLRNVERKDPAISPLGHARQEIHIKQGLEGDKAKEIIKAIKALRRQSSEPNPGSTNPSDRQKERRTSSGDSIPAWQGFRGRPQFQEFPRLTSPTKHPIPSVTAVQFIRLAPAASTRSYHPV